MADLHVTLFRCFQATSSNQPVPGFESRKVQELLSYLLLYRRPHLRDSLVDLLWDGKPLKKARKYMRQTLWRLQRAFEGCKTADVPLLQTDATWIQVHPEAPVSTDVDMFRHQVDSCRGVEGADLLREQVTSLESAVALYKGALLEAWYHDWCLLERERLHTLLIIAIHKLLEYCAATGVYERGIYYGNMALQQDPAQEHTYRLLMRLHCQAGNRTVAVRLYQRCEGVLQQELGLQPSRRTKALYERICMGSEIEVLSSPTPSDASGGALTSPDDLLLHLSQLRLLLQDSQREVERGINALRHGYERPR